MIKTQFGTTADGQSVDQFTLTNAAGMQVKIITWGGAITNVSVPDQAGKLGDVVLGFDDTAGYQRKDNPYFGCIVGRVANRTANGIYAVDGKPHCCALNNAPHSLHGGTKGYDKRTWNVDGATASALKLSLTDLDGTEGYPGTVHASVVYTLSETNALRIEYTATTDKPTPVNLTNHSYWNLKDGGSTTIHDHILKVNAGSYTPVDATLIPTGEIASVKGTAIDFTIAKPMGRDLLSMGGDPAGYDHNLVLNKTARQLAKAVEIYEPTTGRLMEIWTTEPGIQFYSGNFLNGTLPGKSGSVYPRHSGFAFEAQKFPNAINQPNFPSTLLRPSETYHQITEHRFATATKQPF